MSVSKIPEKSPIEQGKVTRFGASHIRKIKKWLRGVRTLPDLERIVAKLATQFHGHLRFSDITIEVLFKCLISSHRPALNDGCAYLSSGLQAAGKLDLVDAMVHWLAVGGALGHGALAATTAHTDAVDNVTCREEEKKKTSPWDWRPVRRGVAVWGCVSCHSPCLALYPSLRALSGRVGLGARWRLDSWRYCQQRTRSRKRITSDCFLRHNSCIYLYAPMLTYLQKGSDNRLNTPCLWTRPTNWTHPFHWTSSFKAMMVSSYHSESVTYSTMKWW